MIVSEIKSILISRTDSIGDVVLTLPMTGVLKKYFPGLKIYFLGKSYTKEVILSCIHVDEFLDWDLLLKVGSNEQLLFMKNKKIDCVVHVFPNQAVATIFKKLKTPFRIGTTNRWFHWFTCNKLISFSRKKSDLHEAQLNFKLLSLFKIAVPQTQDLIPYFGFEKIKPLSEKHLSLLSRTNKNIILHPKSKGSAREWGLENFSSLIVLLLQNKFSVFISGSEEEGKLVAPLLEIHPEVTSVCGKFSLGEFISFISHCDALVAASTGPLHIASALGKKAIGLYAPMRPIHPGRWAPLGKDSHAISLEKNCNDCKYSQECACIKSISPRQVLEFILQ